MTNASLSKRELVAEEDLLRVNLYRLLARCLSSPINQEFITIIRKLEGDESDLGVAFTKFAFAAAETSPKQAEEEYQNLFIGLGRGELLPYGSYYLTGFLNEKPLSRLRTDMSRLNIERDPAITEPEDHAGALMDMMAGLIEGNFGNPEPIEVQKEFFEKHVSNWISHFFKDLQKAEHATLYQSVGLIGELFIEIETAAFSM